MLGGCLCGAIRYRIDGPLGSVSVCHYRSCRLSSGAPTVSWLVVRRSQFQMLQGEPRRYASSPQVRRGFCGRCGTQLTYQHAEAPGEIELTTLSLDEPSEVVPTREIGLSQKVGWAAVDPRLEHYSHGSSGPRIDVG